MSNDVTDRGYPATSLEIQAQTVRCGESTAAGRTPGPWVMSAAGPWAARRCRGLPVEGVRLSMDYRCAFARHYVTAHRVTIVSELNERC